MNVAVILAGGVGSRIGSAVPKQFLLINGVPIIVYTLLKFQGNQSIDKIVVVSHKDYIDDVEKFKTEYSIDKLELIFEGGNSAQESTRNAVFGLKDVCESKDMVMFHMSVSPLIDDEIIEDSLKVCKKNGIAVAASQSLYNICTTDNFIDSNDYLAKKNLVTLNMPWTVYYEKLLCAYQRSFQENIETGQESYLVSLFHVLGEKLYFSRDSQKNKLKVTTIDDLDLLESYINYFLGKQVI